MPFDLGPLFQALLALWTVFFQLRNLDTNILAVVHGFIGVRLAFGVFFLAGLSEAYGTRAVTLFLNRVGRRPFFISLVITSSVFVLGAAIWAFTIRELLVILYAVPYPLGVAMQAVAIGYVPLLFAFLAFVPYIGPALLVILQGLSLLLATLSIHVAFNIGLWEATVVTLGGWLALQLLRLLTAGPTTALSRWILRVISGRKVHYRLRDIVPDVPLGLSDQSRSGPEGGS